MHATIRPSSSDANPSTVPPASGCTLYRPRTSVRVSRRPKCSSALRDAFLSKKLT
ncbi:TPA_asm: UL52.5 sORF 2 [Human alphaherpesvirus 1]|uniref:Uncharacterized protein n=1 Tax=Human herpesvirus 1 TaxID=10298 RepID=A0A2Z4H045_HHV1|nr:hypothetical protein [Human alphaherpesvirus 1]DAC85396.1 TPA_asm: UL52.5 sORF 2 [Human alphaherpesvirus 1]